MRTIDTSEQRRASRLAGGPGRVAGVLALAAALLAGCSDDDTTEAAASADPPPRLDVETLEAEADQGTIEAEPHAGAYVGEVTEDVFIGVAFPDGAAPGAAVTVYLCDDEHGEWFSETLGQDGTLSLEGEEVSVDLELTDDGVSGTATWRGGESESFTATEATGDAGLYSAGGSFDDVEYSAAWVVLDDGRQRGFVPMCPPMPLHVCWTQGL